MAAGANPTVTNVGSSSAAQFNFGIPQAPPVRRVLRVRKARQAPRAAPAPPVRAWPPVGAAGQVLVKNSATNFDTAWGNGQWVQITAAAYAALSPPNANTLYVVIG